jgi:hypothetical protein
MRFYLSVMKYKTRYKAQKACPWAAKIAKCYMGWFAFANLEEFEEYKQDMKKSITIHNK